MSNSLNWFQKLINWLFRGWGWWQRWFGPGSPDDWRNPFWRWTEYNRIKVHKALQDVDFRFGYYKKDSNKWVWLDNRSIRNWVPGQDSNFYNGIFTYSQTITMGEDRDGEIVCRKRFNMVIRFIHAYWFAFGVGTLPDRGEFGWTGPWIFSFKRQNEHNPGVIAPDHQEGAV